MLTIHPYLPGGLVMLCADAVVIPARNKSSQGFVNHRHKALVKGPHMYGIVGVEDVMLLHEQEKAAVSIGTLILKVDP